MMIASILDHKGEDVVTVQPNDTLHQACAILAERKIGAVVIVNAARAVKGILSERDIVRAIGAEGPAALEAHVSDHMTSNVVTCSPEESVLDVMGRMSAGRFRHVPVVKGGKLAGLVSIGDVVKVRIQQAERDADEMRSYILAS